MHGGLFYSLNRSCIKQATQPQCKIRVTAEYITVPSSYLGALITQWKMGQACSLELPSSKESHLHAVSFKTNKPTPQRFKRKQKDLAEKESGINKGTVV